MIQARILSMWYIYYALLCHFADIFLGTINMSLVCSTKLIGNWIVKKTMGIPRSFPWLIFFGNYLCGNCYFWALFGNCQCAYFCKFGSCSCSHLFFPNLCCEFLCVHILHAVWPDKFFCKFYNLSFSLVVLEGSVGCFTETPLFLEIDAFDFWANKNWC